MLNISPKLDAYTPLLSNSCFTSVLWCLFSRWVSCLDAFSIYPLARSCPACPAGQQVDQRRRTSVPLVLENPSFQTSASPVDIKQTASQRSEPSSWSLLIGEHPHPWLPTCSEQRELLACFLHSQDRKSRHRCSKPRRRSVLQRNHSSKSLIIQFAFGIKFSRLFWLPLKKPRNLFNEYFEAKI